MVLRFEGKTVVITGSGTGIGKAIAKRFAEEGASVVILGRRRKPLEQTKAMLEDIIKSINSNAKVAMYDGVDVSDEDALKVMFESIAREFGHVDILVNNAGVSGPVKSFPAQPFNEFKECVAIHLTGTFRASVNALPYMSRGGKIITIATYFTEEKPYEQRPYRFRTPYTAAQGAKNRLAEALAWELVSKDIRSIATNPGPVHSDRIYKTVYPKAAAEFLRISGFKGLKAREVEKIAEEALPLLGEDGLEDAIDKVSEDIAKARNASKDEVKRLVKECLSKMQEIAEKIQNNTSKMIIDQQFLTQEETADIVLNLADDNISRLVNGRVMPADRVFYPVKPLVANTIQASDSIDLAGKFVILSIASNEQRHVALAKELIDAFTSRDARCIALFSNEFDSIPDQLKDIHSHIIDLSNEDEVKKMFSIASNKFGKPDITIHITGNYDYSKELSSLSREEWDRLVDRYINIPALVCKEAINAMVPNNLEDPSLFKDSNGKIIIIGPDAPIGKKIHGSIRARAEVFRGALRPFTATVNQELKEVLGSNIRLYLILPGSIDGREPDNAKTVNACLALADSIRSEVIYYPDEA